MKIYYRPDSNTSATVLATENGSGYFYGSAYAGGSLMAHFPVKSGMTYQAQASQSGSVTLAFMPFLYHKF